MTFLSKILAWGSAVFVYAVFTSMMFSLHNALGTIFAILAVIFVYLIYSTEIRKKRREIMTDKEKVGAIMIIGSLAVLISTIIYLIMLPRDGMAWFLFWTTIICIILFSLGNELFFSDNIDSSSWRQFENDVADEFRAYADKVKLTKSGADGGIDVIVEHNGVRIGVQVKHWKNKVGNKAVGETLMGMGTYNCDYGCVVAPNGYTEACKSSARKNNIELLDFSDILCYMGKM